MANKEKWIHAVSRLGFTVHLTVLDKMDRVVQFCELCLEESWEFLAHDWMRNVLACYLVPEMSSEMLVQFPNVAATADGAPSRCLLCRRT